MTFFEKVYNTGIVPVVALNNADDAVPLAKALLKGGIDFMEITFRTECAAESIALIAKEVPEMTVGAGRGNNIPVIPGCVTPTEIMKAISLGLNVVKFFPADVFGGIKAIKALSAPFGQVKFLPTGGVSAANLPEFVANKSIAAVGGSWVCKKDDIANHDWDKITALSAEAVKIIKETRV